MNQEELYNFWTRNKLKSILSRLSRDFRSSWSKGKLVAALCEVYVEDVLDVLESKEVDALLEEFGASTTGGLYKRKQRLRRKIVGSDEPSEEEPPQKRVVETPTDTEGWKRWMRSARFFRVRQALDNLTYSCDPEWFDAILGEAKLDAEHRFVHPYSYKISQRIHEKHWFYVTLRMWLKRQKEVGSVESINLSGCTQILKLGLPPELYAFSDTLQSINLSKCRLKELPIGLRRFTNLQHVNVSRNVLTDVDVLKGLPLLSLNVSRNELPSYPKWFLNIPECNLALSIDWAHDLYRKTWVNLEQMDKKNYASYSQYDETMQEYIPSLQPHLQTIQEKWNVKGYSFEGEAQSEHSVYTPPAKDIVHMFMRETSRYRGVLRFSSQKNARYLMYLPLWAYVFLEKDHCVYLIRARTKEATFQYFINEVFPEDFPNLNRQYEIHEWGYNEVRVLRNFQRQVNYSRIDDWSDLHPKLRISRLTSESLRKSYLSGSTNARDVYRYQDLYHINFYFQDGEEFSFSHRAQHLDVHYYDHSLKSNWLTMNGTPREIHAYGLSNEDDLKLIQQYRNQEKIEKVILRYCDIELPDMSGFHNLKELHIQNSLVWGVCKESLPKNVEIIIDDAPEYSNMMSTTKKSKLWLGEKYSKRVYPDVIPYFVDKRDKEAKGEEQLFHKHIELRDCGLTEVPAWLKKTKGTKIIDLRENQIAELPGWLFTIRGVQKIYLDHNPITSIDNLNLRKRTASLQLISLRHCLLSALPGYLAQYYPCDMDLRHNRIKKLAHGRIVDREYYTELETDLTWCCTPFDYAKLDGNPLEKML